MHFILGLQASWPLEASRLEAVLHEAEAKTHEAEAEARTHEAEAEAKTHEAEAEAEARFFGLEAEARPVVDYMQLVLQSPFLINA